MKSSIKIVGATTVTATVALVIGMMAKRKVNHRRKEKEGYLLKEYYEHGYSEGHKDGYEEGQQKMEIKPEKTGRSYSYEKFMDTLRRSEAGEFDYTGWKMVTSEQSGFDRNYYNGRVVWGYDGAPDDEFYFTVVTEDGHNARIVSVMRADGTEINYDESFIVQYFILRTF
ncbi:MAG: hypothetical protein K0R00_50 [Herbinix sp.]|jgi:hypothetical protein|nr:hypothetical protein [Herbinix sp.]